MKRWWMRPSTVLATLCLCSSVALGHGQAVDLDRWGPFIPASARCLREMSRALDRCFIRTFDLRQECQRSEIAGGACDASERDRKIDAAIVTMTDSVRSECRVGHLTEIFFLGFGDVNTDLTQGCRVQSERLIDQIFRQETNDEECLSEVASAARQVFRFAFRAKAQDLDHIATTFLWMHQRQEMMAADAQQIARAIQVASERTLVRCPGFESQYGQTPQTFYAKVATRANCVLRAAYVQSTIICPVE